MTGWTTLCFCSLSLSPPSEPPQSDGEENQHREQGCWHGRPTARIIHSQNITFIKTPGQNIKVRLTHFLPSGRYQVAMVPYRKDWRGQLLALAPPSCTSTLVRLDLGKHALSFILSKDNNVTSSEYILVDKIGKV